MMAVTAEHSAAADALLVGRNTFEAFRSFWPKQTNDRTGISGYLNDVSKYVVSRTLKDPEWQNSTVLRDDLADEVQALKKADGRDIIATGSIQLVHALIEAGTRRRVPAVRLPRRGRARCATLRVCRPLPAAARCPTFVSGVVLLRYVPARRP